MDHVTQPWSLSKVKWMFWICYCKNIKFAKININEQTMNISIDKHLTTSKTGKSYIALTFYSAAKSYLIYFATPCKVPKGGSFLWFLES